MFDIAHHLSHARDGRAFGYHLLAGAVSIAAYSMDTALEHLLIAESRQPEGLTRSARFHLSFLLAKARATTECRDEAVQHYERAFQLAASRAERAECLFAQSTLYWERSEYDPARKCVRQGLRELDESIPSTFAARLAATAWAIG